MPISGLLYNNVAQAVSFSDREQFFLISLDLRYAYAEISQGNARRIRPEKANLTR